MKISKLFLLLLTGLFLIMAPLSSALAASTQTQKEIEVMLVCQDGCNMVLAACDNETALYMRKIIVQKLEAGQNKEQILDYFVETYGEQVLTAPDPKVAFNLTAWLTPFIALILGGIGLYALISKWVLKAEEARLDEESELEELQLTPEQQSHLQAELKKYM